MNTPTLLLVCLSCLMLGLHAGTTEKPTTGINTASYSPTSSTGSSKAQTTMSTSLGPSGSTGTQTTMNYTSSPGTTTGSSWSSSSSGSPGTPTRTPVQTTTSAGNAVSAYFLGILLALAVVMHIRL